MTTAAPTTSNAIARGMLAEFEQELATTRRFIERAKLGSSQEDARRSVASVCARASRTTRSIVASSTRAGVFSGEAGSVGRGVGEKRRGS